MIGTRFFFSRRKSTAISRYLRESAVCTVEALEARELLTTYYVSSTGHDNRTGTSTANAWKTIAKVNTVNFAAGDIISFQGGATFSGTLAFDVNDTGTDASPVTVNSWGTGRATISSGTGNAVSGHNAAGINITNLNFVGASNNTVDGITFWNDQAGDTKLSHVYIDQVDVSGYGKNGITIGGLNNYSGYNNIRITNSKIHHNKDNGIFFYAALGKSNSNVYVGKVEVYDNSGFPTDPASDYRTGSGLRLFSVDGAVVEQSAFHDNGYGGWGTNACWTAQCNNVLFQFNEAYNHKVTGTTDGGGFAFDGGTTNSLMQYNYSHNNYGTGFGAFQYLYAMPWDNNTYRYNITQNDGRANWYGGISFYNGYPESSVSNAKFYNNTIYISPSAISGATPAAIIFKTRTVNTILRNNIVYITGGLRLIDSRSTQTGVLFQGNDYFASGGSFKIFWNNSTTYTSLSAWRTATGHEKLNGANTGYDVDPKLANPGGGGDINNSDLLNQLTAYKLQSTSPLINKGLNLTTLFGIDNGGRDFFGNPAPFGNGYDIGAHEYEQIIPVPAAPTGLTATAFSATRIDLAWTASSGANSYRIERQGPGQSSFTEIASNVTTTGYQDTTVSPNSTYTYQVRAENNGGISSPSNTDSATTPQTLPAAPTGLAASAASTTRINLTWNAVSNASSYRVERKAPGESVFTEIASGITAASYADQTVSANKTYSYQVRAQNSAGLSGYSNIASATTPATTSSFTSADIGATPAGSTTVINDGIDYTVIAGGPNIYGTADGFRFVYQQRTGDFDVKVKVLSLTNTDPTAKAGIMARDTLNANSINIYSTATAADTYRLSYRTAAGGTTTLVKGTAVAYPNVWVRLKRAGSVFTAYSSTDGTNWTQVSSKTMTMASTVYLGMAATSANSSVTTTAEFRQFGNVGATAPAAPSGLVATPVASDRIDLGWNASSGATSYRIERKDPGGSFSQIASGVTATTFIDSGRSPSTTYSYQVRAENSAGLSPYSNTATATTPAVSATGYTGVDIGSPAVAGSTTTITAGSAYDIRAGGTDIFGTSDQFHFAYRQITGDFDIKVRLQSLTAADPWSKAGLMARTSLAANSANVFMLASPGTNGERFTYRSATGGTTATGSGTVSYPNTWLRLQRVGNTFTGYRSTDGLAWTMVSSITLALPTTLYFGMAVTSHNASASTTAQFRDLQNV